MSERWDAHAHVIGATGRFPFAAGRSYTPGPAPLDDYLAMLDRHGIARGVLVQPSAYGYDNSCLLDALESAGGRLAGVAVPPPDATAGDFEEMHARGVRAVRLNLINPGPLPVDVVVGWQPRLRALGWHVELHVEIEHLADVAALVRNFGVPVVIDHMGRLTPGRTDPSLPHVQRLIALVRDSACYVKVSAPYRLSQTGAPWPDVVPLAQAFITANPRACLWGTDWPHVHTARRVQDDDLVTALLHWCPDEVVRQVVCSAGAEVLFDPAPKARHAGNRSLRSGC
jgi:predicted TIM-barrel fold metal-dependent hydrolase